MLLTMDKIRRLFNWQTRYWRSRKTSSVPGCVIRNTANTNSMCLTFVWLLNSLQGLKAIALLRMGRQEEAISTMNTVLGSHPGDQATLQACTMYFKENSDCMPGSVWTRIKTPLLSLPPLPLDLKIAEMYATAALHYPKNQEILTHLFMAYVRVGDYQKQQHTAVQLHKAFPESGPYYCWRVMSILMQVCIHWWCNFIRLVSSIATLVRTNVRSSGSVDCIVIMCIHTMCHSKAHWPLLAGEILNVADNIRRCKCIMWQLKLKAPVASKNKNKQFTLSNYMPSPLWSALWSAPWPILL